jgi:hypothetical protein
MQLGSVPDLLLGDSAFFNLLFSLNNLHALSIFRHLVRNHDIIGLAMLAASERTTPSVTDVDMQWNVES